MRPDETPVRGGSAPVGSVPSPGTPPGAGQTQGGLLPASVRVTKFQTRWQRFLGAVGTAVGRYSGTVVPTVVLNRHNPEDDFPDDVRFAGGLGLAQVAGNLIQLQLQAPTAGVLVLDRIFVQRLNTAGLVYVWFGAQLAPILLNPFGGPIVRDTRGRVVGVGGLGKSVAASTAPTNFAIASTGASVDPAELRGYVLGVVQGANLIFECETANEGLAVYYEGRYLAS